MALGLDERISLGWLALLRVATGALFLQGGLDKLRSGFGAQALAAQLAAWSAAGRTFAFAQGKLDAEVLPRLELFAKLVTWGELLAGASLLLGLASRLGALAGLLLNVAFFLASRQEINLLMALVNLAALVVGGGRALGVDRLLKVRMPRYFLG